MCPQGYYCEEGTATPHGSPCPVGTAGEQLGQTSRAACKRCREGRFCPAGKSLHLYTHFTGATETETQKNVRLRKWINSHFGKSNEKKSVCYDKTSLVLFTSMHYDQILDGTVSPNLRFSLYVCCLNQAHRVLAYLVLEGAFVLLVPWRKWHVLQAPSPLIKGQ